MKATRQSIGRAVDQPNPQVRFFLFHGPDDAQSRALGHRLLRALGAEKVMIAPGAVKSDPATLSDEAGALSLFVEKRAIWIEPAGEEIVQGVSAVLEAATIESPVIVIAGPLKRTSTLLKLGEHGPLALAYASYVPEGQEAERMVMDVGRACGLKVSPSVASRIAAAAGNDQALVSQELQKLALYVDASPQAPKELDHDALDAVGTDTAEGDVLRLADLALGGELNVLAEELSRLLPGASDGIPVIRSLQRRLLMLAPARARIERGESPDAVMTSLGKSLFWKDKANFAKMLVNWNSERLAKVSERAGRLERGLMFSPAPGQESLGEELLAIAREARRR